MTQIAKTFSIFALAALVLFSQGQPDKANGRNVGVIVFDVTPDRLSPSSMTVTQGWYIVRVRNGISLSQLPVQLNHETAGAVVNTNVKAGASAVQQLTHLQPGKHTLIVGGRAKWTAMVTVTPAN